MKKIIIILVFISFATASHAQWFTGGSLDYRSTSEENSSRNNNEKDSYSVFSIAPMIGYQKGKFAFGASFIYNTGTEKEMLLLPGHWAGPGWDRSLLWWPPILIETKSTTESTFWGIQPFFRYTFAEFGRFSVFANARVHFLSGTTEQTLKYEHSDDSFPGFHYDATSLGINIAPMLSFSLSEKINLETALNFMNFGFNRTIKKHKESEDKDTITDFGLGINSENVANIGTVSIGFIYKF
jgi:hypothetical protein